MRVMARPAARNTIKPMKAHLKRYVRGAGWANNGIRVKSGNRNIMDDLKDGRKFNKKRESGITHQVLQMWEHLLRT